MDMMTTQFGLLEYEQDDVITFPSGMPGFEHRTAFLLIPAQVSDENSFWFLQSIQEGELSFILLDTLSFFPHYEFQLHEGDIEKLQAEEAIDLRVLTVVTLKGDLQSATTNLRAPVMINHKLKLGRQVLLTGVSYSLRQPLFAADREVANVGQKG